MNENLSQVTKTLSEREKISAIIWLVVGIIQCITCAGIICGAWNIYCSVCRFKNSTAVLTPWKGIVESYDKWINMIIVGLVINLILGGIFGVAGSIYDLLAVRDYALKNKQVFEQAGL